MTDFGLLRPNLAEDGVFCEKGKIPEGSDSLGLPRDAILGEPGKHIEQTHSLQRIGFELFLQHGSVRDSGN